ncbi:MULTISPECIES: polysaccharide deacetylase family sporulation protein PdaB [Clostridia]|uniref:polysaccharide deacetylase family sporulation protein PdaB n=1 Tax=Clostridia TaxID=186801 RepID=UPI000EA1F6C1|nr:MULTISPECIES: polysaccharide deacetylase family sporulation protein PdaB [Clostridia]NBJ70781.1 polysaccharide deacetylase family sporulation protein PdaB [Roseburia sp. 1XD42-34]RKI75754.1 polysaccharide deacetylase family sporulation protein PdaB [Clostridium sp. 1xD42-85]
MQHFYVWRFNKWKRWFAVAAVALFTATFLWLEWNGEFTVFSNKEPTAMSKGNANENNIALTFNISWGEERVDHILKRLKEEGVQATFFVSGEWAEKHPDIVEKIAKNKHELGMLGYRYKSYLDQDLETVSKDLRKAREVFHKLGYEEVSLLRPPSGHFNKDIIETAENMGYNVIHWNVNPHDWKNPGTNTIVDYVMKNTTNGDIILLHASDSVKQTAKALETILPGLKNKGFSFVSMTELINQAHASAELVE